MPPKKAAADADAPTGMSANELRFIKVMFDNMTQKPDADWDKVASDMNLKDAKCAKERFRQMSVRHGWNTTGGGSGAGGNGGGAAGGKTASGRVAKKPKAAPKKKVKKEETPDTDVEDEVKVENDDVDGEV